jgi:hypothetical protein
MADVMCRRLCQEQRVLLGEEGIVATPVVHGVLSILGNDDNSKR